MKFGGSTSWFLLAGATISILAGFSLAAVDFHFHDTNRLLRYGYRSPYVRFLDACMSCGFFGVVRAVVSLVAIVLLVLSRFLKPFIIFIVFLVSAGLYIGELFSGSFVIKHCGRGAIYNENTEQNYWEDMEYARWATDYYDRQAEYMVDDNEEWGPYLFTWKLFTPATYEVPPWKQWVQTTDAFGKVKYDWWTDDVSDIEPCIIDYNRSKDILEWSEGGVTLYDCDRLDLVVVECLSGWNERALNSEVKRTCKEENEAYFTEWDDSKTNSDYPWKAEKAESRRRRRERARRALEDVEGVYMLNSILIALETGSFALTLVGALLSLFAGDGCTFKRGKQSTSTSDAAETVQTDSDQMMETVQIDSDQMMETVQTDSDVPLETAGATAIVGQRDTDLPPSDSSSTAADAEAVEPKQKMDSSGDGSSVFQSSDSKSVEESSTK